MAFTLTHKQVREVYQAIVEQNSDFIKALAVCVIQDGITVSEDMALDMSDQEIIDNPPTEKSIKGIGLSIIADQLGSLGEDVEKAVKEMPVAFKAELVLEFKNVIIG